MFNYDGLSLRKIERRDLPLLQSLKNESWFATHTLAIVNDEDQERWFNSLDTNTGNPKNLILIAEYDQYRIGVFKIRHIEWINRTADVAWDIFEHFRGKGHGKALVKAGVEFCFSMLNLRRLDAEILKTNKASQKCAELAGFEYEGCKRKAVHCRKAVNCYVDSLIYGCLRTSDAF